MKPQSTMNAPSTTTCINTSKYMYTTNTCIHSTTYINSAIQTHNPGPSDPKKMD